MESALIVSCTEKFTVFFTEILNTASVKRISVLKSCSEARRLLLEHDFDLVIINAPLRDETGEMFARNIAVKGMSQVILVIKSEHFDAVSANCENDGVLTVAKPINKTIFWSALTLAKSSRNMMSCHLLLGRYRLQFCPQDDRQLFRRLTELASCYRNL